MPEMLQNGRKMIVPCKPCVGKRKRAGMRPQSSRMKLRKIQGPRKIHRPRAASSIENGRGWRTTTPRPNVPMPSKLHSAFRSRGSPTTTTTRRKSDQRHKNYKNSGTDQQHAGGQWVVEWGTKDLPRTEEVCDKTQGNSRAGKKNKIRQENRPHASYPK